MGSKAKFDNCGLCNGAGNTCTGHTGKYNENHPGGKQNTLTIFCKLVHFHSHKHKNSSWRHAKRLNDVDRSLLIGYQAVLTLPVGSTGITIQNKNGFCFMGRQLKTLEKHFKIYQDISFQRLNENLGLFFVENLKSLT